MKCILFDLDETLSDHRYACQQGIQAIIELCPELRIKTVEQLENEFWQMLNGNYYQVLNGSLSMKDTRLQRIAALFKSCELEPPEQLTQLADAYLHHYGQSARAIPGMTEVLQRIKRQNSKVAVVTNGFKDIQRKKLADCHLQEYIDIIITSEEAGAAKPDPKIFLQALSACGVQPHETVMIGDSWVNDIAGAAAVGIKGIWLNRRNEPCPDPSVATVIHDPDELFVHLGLD
jgi:putative hydrolase of the HAD superfamily